MRKAIQAGLPFVFIAIAHLSGPAAAQEPATQRDPESVAALERMGAALRAMDSFAMHADVTREDVLSTGQKIQYSGTLDIQSRSRNAFGSTSSSRQNRSFYYDGQNLTVVAPRAGLLRVRPGDRTARGCGPARPREMDIDFPLADLFTFGADPAAITRITSASIGLGDDQRPAMPAARHAPGGNDWQGVDPRGDNPLPCKIVITTTSDPSNAIFGSDELGAPPDLRRRHLHLFTVVEQPQDRARVPVPASPLAPAGN